MSEDYSDIIHKIDLHLDSSKFKKVITIKNKELKGEGQDSVNSDFFV